ncbi:MAG: DNA-3-methyladenine glycosylase I [Candidatus Dadabacteria bacterium]|nr:DNA-3-methyladenine glycosylase I [Candidatus Dadabacteria bacterium]
MKTNNKPRCSWMGDDKLMLRYHDKEWGVPVHDDRKWFEYLILDAFQAGLSWKTVLNKREGFREVFFGFDPERVSKMTEKEMESARNNSAIIRNRLKIKSAVTNAKAFLKLQEKHGSFDSYIWSFTEGQVVNNSWKDLHEIPASTPLSDEISKSLKQEGFSFVGTTICYAFLQAAGVINDHLISCFRYEELKDK